MEGEVWEAVSSVLGHPARLRAGLEGMIESERRTLVSSPEKEISCWSERVKRAREMRSRYEDQQAEGLMTREELRAKLAELDAFVRTAEAEIEKRWRREEHIRALEKSGEELLEGYAELVPGKLREVYPEEKAPPPVAADRSRGTQ